jgi:hypothetical protein
VCSISDEKDGVKLSLSPVDLSYFVVLDKFGDSFLRI